MQLHMRDGAFRFFSRNGFDFSDDFGRSPAEGAGKFCSFVSDCLQPSVRSAIIDGEICAFNHVTGALTQKGEQMNIRSLGADHPMFQQCLYAYDIVYLNGAVLTNRPLRERVAILRDTLRELPGRVQLAERWTGRAEADVVAALNEAIDRRDEGVVLKDPDSVYRPNARAKGGWLKMKPEYADSLVDQCDLIVMGGYYGSGRRGGGTISHFLLGLAVAKEGSTSEDDPAEFHSFCRVGSGYSSKELSDLLQRLQPHFKRGGAALSAAVSSSSCKLEFGREKPDVWLDPKKSVLLQVKATEIIASSVYKTECTLR